MLHEWYYLKYYKESKYYDNLGVPLAVAVIVEFVAISAAWATAADIDLSTNCWYTGFMTWKNPPTIKPRNV